MGLYNIPFTEDERGFIGITTPTIFGAGKKLWQKKSILSM